MEKLTKKQESILHFIKNCQQDDGETPSMREIAEHFGYKSVNAVQDHIKALRRKGVLQKVPGQARSLKIISPLNELRRQVIDVPVYGGIPAGRADPRHQEPMGCISVDVNTLGISPTTRTFALQVSGDSMIGKHICDGDFVVCEHGLTPRSGNVVAALIDNESTLKTYIERYRKPYLKAENPDYPDLLPAGELLIQGVVVAVIRKFNTRG